jgi:hypothetical protein
MAVAHLRLHVREGSPFQKGHRGFRAYICASARSNFRNGPSRDGIAANLMQQLRTTHEPPWCCPEPSPAWPGSSNRRASAPWADDAHSYLGANRRGPPGNSSCHPDGTTLTACDHWTLVTADPSGGSQVAWRLATPIELALWVAVERLELCVLLTSNKASFEDMGTGQPLPTVTESRPLVVMQSSEAGNDPKPTVSLTNPE